MFIHLCKQVAEEYSAQNAYEMTAAIHGYDRWSSFAQYQRCGNYCATRMREYGLEDVEEMQVPADGATRIGDWVMPLAWDVEDATLQVVEPDNVGRILAHYREEPACLAIWSAPTSPDGIEAELVFLEAGSREEDYAQVDVKGKVIFTHQSHGEVRGLAARHGAIGFITDSPACKEEALANSVLWMNSWVDYHGWGFLKSDTPIWGFSLTREKGHYLERLLRTQTRVMVHAVVKSCLYDGSFMIPTGVIRGESEQEILVYAHSYEYGAEDNATGCATVLESARTLSLLIQKGILPRPKRTIRFMMSWECYGSIPWAVQRIYGKRNVVAGLCLDAFAGKRSITGGKISIALTPHCQASYTDYLVTELASTCFQPQEDYPCVLTPWSGGTDHTVFEDPQFGIPMPWLSEYPSRFHHTSLDEMDKIDSRSLGVEGVFAATYLYFLANAAEAESQWLAAGTRGFWQDKLKQEARKAQEALLIQGTQEEQSVAWQDAHERILYLADRGTEAIRSIERLCAADQVQHAILEQTGELGHARDHYLGELQNAVRERACAQGWIFSGPAKLRQPRDGANLIPQRLVPGLLTLCTISKGDRAEFTRVTGGQSPMWSTVLTFGLYWADGKRTIGEIQRLVELEFGATEIDLGGYFRFLQRLGYVAWA